MSADWKVNHKISSWTLLDTQNQPTTDLLIHLSVSYLRLGRKFILDYLDDGIKYYFENLVVLSRCTDNFFGKKMILPLPPLKEQFLMVPPSPFRTKFRKYSMTVFRLNITHLLESPNLIILL